MNNLALVVNTVSKNADVWPMFFGQIEAHWPTGICKKYLCTDKETETIPPDWETLLYDGEETTYREQFLSCIEQVEEQYCIYISEDYILYDDVQMDLIETYVKLLGDRSHLSFIRLIRGGVVDFLSPYIAAPNLYEMHHSFPYFYTNQAAIWRTRDLEKIHAQGPNLHIATRDWENSFEYQATQTCQALDIQGIFCYHGEPKRGIYHYDSSVFPHIATALVKGQWNLSEYPELLASLCEKYHIEMDVRGTV